MKKNTKLYTIQQEQQKKNNKNFFFLKIIRPDVE